MTLSKPFALALMLAGIAALILPAASQQPKQEQLFDPPPHQAPAKGAASKAKAEPADPNSPPMPRARAKAPPSKAEPADPDAPPAPRAKAKAAAPKAGPAETLVGTWAGKVTQIEHDQGYTVVLTVRPGAATTEYPELGCSGTLSRLAGSGPYVFYLAKITRGRHDAGGRCPDGTAVIARAGDKLGFSWFGTVDGHVIFVYGALTRR